MKGQRWEVAEKRKNQKRRSQKKKSQLKDYGAQVHKKVDMLRIALFVWCFLALEGRKGVQNCCLKGQLLNRFAVIFLETTTTTTATANNYSTSHCIRTTSTSTTARNSGNEMCQIGMNFCIRSITYAHICTCQWHEGLCYSLMVSSGDM